MISKNFQIENNEGNTKEIDEKLNARLSGQKDIGVFIEKFNDMIQSTCKKMFKFLKSLNTAAKGKSVRWWTDVLKIMRKRTNTLRRRYQRTLNSEELREIRKNQYIKGKKKYQAAIRKAKINSWKQYCNTSPSNPWNEAYKLASRKTRNTVTRTTLQKPDGSKTANIIETMKHMIEQLIPEDNTQDDTDCHMNIRRLTEQPIETTDGREFTQDEVRQIIEDFNPRKAPGPDGITSESLTLIFKSIPKTVTFVYSECLKTECFPKNL